MIKRILSVAMLSATLMSSGVTLSTFAQDQNKMNDAMMKSGDKMMKAHKSKRRSRRHKAPKKSMMKADKMKSDKSM